MAAVLLGLLLMCNPYNPALAASGGRIGGSSFSSRSSSSSSSSGGSSYSTSSSSWSEGSSYSSSLSKSKSDSESESESDLGSELIEIVVRTLIRCLVRLSFQIFSDWLESRGSERTAATERTSVRTSVIKLQVGLSSTARALQRDLNQIAADTSTSEGQTHVLTEATLALLRNPDYCISAYSSVDVKVGKSTDLVPVLTQNVHFGPYTLKRSILVPLLTEVCTTSPKIDSPSNWKWRLKRSLAKACLHPGKQNTVEVLWTPRNENDTLSERELLEDYPLLRELGI
ncbi:hypothetical protein CCACVL1_22922 [Corchorus capsularis]|uniref:Uncharacterized protein n=1 Tax=Corchorus capsularis TaxID=210143 RepID=A0A1R3GW68_COCAP|nr:hypothetical protein CCACVL1_22922 [Corchorus capsularis]